MRLALALPFILLAGAADAATPIAGRWITAGGKAMVRIDRCGTEICGRIERVLKATPGGATTDVNNKDKGLRARPFVGLPILTGFTDQGKDWRGRIYNPEDGKTYKSVVTRAADGTLKVKGCVAFLCQTQTWQPAGG